MDLVVTTDNATSDDKVVAIGLRSDPSKAGRIITAERDWALTSDNNRKKREEC